MCFGEIPQLHIYMPRRKSLIYMARNYTLLMSHSPFGYAVTITAVSTSNETHSWIAQSSSLLRHSEYFQTQLSGIGGKITQMTIHDINPDTFQMLVDFEETGGYSSIDDFANHHKIRCSAELWVLGNNFGSRRTSLQDLALRDLFEAFGLEVGMSPITGVGPAMVRFACSETSRDSPVYRMTLAFCVRNWHEPSRVVYNSGERGNSEEWEKIWHDFPEFRNTLLYELNQSDRVRGYYGCELDKYL
jgi:hypothetical protein